MLIDEENKKVNESDDDKIQSADEYAQAIKKLKETTVPLDDYEKLKEEKATLIKALAGEGPAPDGVQKQAEQQADINELRKKFLDAGEENLSNAEYLQTALKLRKAAIEKGEPDPFIPVGAKVTPTPSDVAGAEKVANAIQSWLDAATDDNGKVDEELLNAYIKKGIAEDSPIITARIKAAEKAQKARK